MDVKSHLKYARGSDLPLCASPAVFTYPYLFVFFYICLFLVVNLHPQSIINHINVLANCKLSFLHFYPQVHTLFRGAEFVCTSQSLRTAGL